MFSFLFLLHLCSIAGNILQSPHCNLPAYMLNPFPTTAASPSPSPLWTPSFVTKCVRIKHCTTRSYFLQFVTHLILKQITDSFTSVCVCGGEPKCPIYVCVPECVCVVGLRPFFGTFFKRAGTNLNDMQIKTWLPKKNVRNLIMCMCVYVCVCMCMCVCEALWAFLNSNLNCLLHLSAVNRTALAYACWVGPQNFWLN